MDEQEQDTGFPSGPWVGYWTYAKYPQKGFHQTELELNFKAGRISGSGQDSIGKFNITGKYHLDTRKCNWTKTYVGAHSLNYEGQQLGKTIQGSWDTGSNWTGSFAIWPEGEPGLAGEFFLTESRSLTLELVGRQ